MLPAALEITAEVARRSHRRAVLLDQPVADVGAALAHHGYVQIDPVNVCGRMHDLILRNRVLGYREGDLMRHLHGAGVPLVPEQRRAIEHHLPSSSILVAFPLDAWPHLLTAMQSRARQRGAWSGRLTPRERELAERILGAIGERGPLSSEHIDDDRRGRRVWGSSTLAKATLQKLFFHGRVLIARRENHRRLYDLPERVLPASVLAMKPPGTDDTARWLVLTKLRQRRLVMLKRGELPLVENDVQPVRVPGCPVLYCLRADVPLIEEVAAGPADTAIGLRLLAPLDPLIYDRRVTRALWGFDYTWEVYTPAHKRVRGHYSLPALAGTELVGHVDPKADRPNRKLLLSGKKLRRGYAVSGALRELAAFLDLRR